MLKGRMLGILRLRANDCFERRISQALRSGWRIDGYSLRSAEKTKKSQPLRISPAGFSLHRAKIGRAGDPAPARLRLAHARKPAQERDPSLRSGFRLRAPARLRLAHARKPAQERDPSLRSGFRLRASARLRLAHARKPAQHIMLPGAPKEHCATHST